MAVKKFDKNRPIPIPSTEELQEIWLTLSPTDRELLIGHSMNDLTEEDMRKLMRTIAKLR